jgi:hypothetical protein
MKVNKISWKLTKFHGILLQFWCILLTFAFTFGAFKSWPQNFGLVQTDLKFQNFGLGNGERWKIQYCSYLDICESCLRQLWVLAVPQIINWLARAKLAKTERNHFAVNFQKQQKQKLTKYIEIEQNWCNIPWNFINFCEILLTFIKPHKIS